MKVRNNYSNCPKFQVMLLMLLYTSSSTATSTLERRHRSFPEHFSSALSIHGLRSQVQVAPSGTLELKCELNYNGNDDYDDYEDKIEVKHNTEWLFIPDLGNESVVLAVDGVKMEPKKSHEIYDNEYETRLEVSVHKSWDSVEDLRVEEHFLQLENFQSTDQGIYICQAVSEQRMLMASRHSLVTMATEEHIVDDVDIDEDEEYDLDESMASVLGPIRERFVLARKGMSVVLECHDADADALELHWRKHGDPKVRGTGRHLRLYRVDRWDSGEYYCATNVTNRTTEDIRFNVTLRVNHEPRVIIAWPIVNQSAGRPARLSCRVEALPVPAIHWLKVEGEEEMRLQSDDDFGLTIDSFGDGFVEAVLNVREVSHASVGKYMCVGSNELGSHNATIDLVMADDLIDVDNAASYKSSMLKAVMMSLILLFISDM